MAASSAALPTVPDATVATSLKHWRWRVFAATWLCYAGYYFCRKPFSIVKSDLGHALGFGADDLALVYSSYLIAYTVGQFAAGAVGPRFGPRVMLIAGMVLSIATSIAFGFTHQLAWFVTLMAINGLAQATGWSSNVGTMASWFHRGERGTVMGIWATNFQVGGVGAGALAAFVLARMGYEYAFFSGAAVLLGVLVFFVFNHANRPEDKGLPAIVDPADDDAGENAPAPSPERWDAKIWTTVLLVGGAYFCMKFIRYALWSWAPFVLSRNFHLHGDDAGYISTVFDIAGIAGVVTTGWLSDKVFAGRRAKVSFYMLLGMVAASLLLFTIGSTSVVAFAVCIGLVGFTLYGPDALLTGAGAMDIGSKDGAVRAAGIISGLGSAGSVMQELVIGKSYSSTGGAIGPILAMLLGSALVSALCVGVILWRNRQGMSDV
jgi:OPA family glycerol-3-phosphate transporter-like MFS transporter